MLVLNAAKSNQQKPNSAVTAQRRMNERPKEMSA
jgi:hypothetical protein